MGQTVPLWVAGSAGSSSGLLESSAPWSLRWAGPEKPHPGDEPAPNTVQHNDWLTLAWLCLKRQVYRVEPTTNVCVHTTWWQLNSFMTEASLRNSILSLMLADSLTVLMATRVSGSSLTTPFAKPSYTMPKDPWPSSRLREIFSRATSHSSGTYTVKKKEKEGVNKDTALCVLSYSDNNNKTLLYISHRHTLLTFCSTEVFWVNWCVQNSISKSITVPAKTKSKCLQTQTHTDTTCMHSFGIFTVYNHLTYHSFSFQRKLEKHSSVTFLFESLLGLEQFRPLI